MDRQTKIVCTIGPATESPEMIKKLISAGMNVARLNFSHGNNEQKTYIIESIRNLSKELNIPIAILQDLSGPKIRTGELASDNPVFLTDGSEFTLTGENKLGDEQGVCITYYKVLSERLKPNDQIYLADGSIHLLVTSIDKNGIKCRVISGGELRAKQGINIPNVSLNIPAVTEKDLLDLNFGIEHGVDFIALSFVQRAWDLIPVKNVLQNKGLDIPVIAKIEKHEALENIDEIIDIADGIMIARGDLGIEIPLEQVPIVQKMIINKAGKKGKPVITATQMLESMIENPRPTRAEVTDVANAILDGTDAVMLSGETAIGKYPIQAVEMMNKIALSTEAVLPYEDFLRQRSSDVNHSIPDAISHAACYTALDINAKAIICCTQSGYTARMVTKYRPKPMIIAVTPLEQTYRRLALSWGVMPLMVEETENTDQMIEKALKAAKKAGVVAGDNVVITAGAPIGVSGKTNMIKADVIPED
ncbi:MAG: pyruvate kinase [bacterium]